MTREQRLETENTVPREQLAEAQTNVDKFSTLADERHDLLSAERRANDELREERSRMLASLGRAQQGRRDAESQLAQVEKECQKWQTRAGQNWQEIELLDLETAQELVYLRDRAAVAAVEGDVEKKIGFNVDGPFEQAVDKYHGELWIDKDGFANFKWHIEGGDFTSAREALVAFVRCLQDRLNKEQDCPYYERPSQPHTGALIDAWEGLPNDIKAELREVAPSFVNAIMALYRAAASSPAPVEPEAHDPECCAKYMRGEPVPQGAHECGNIPWCRRCPVCVADAAATTSPETPVGGEPVCAECDHAGPRDASGMCMFDISAYSDSEGPFGLQVYCGCKCEFAPVADNEGEVCPHCQSRDCECSDFDVSPDMGAK